MHALIGHTGFVGSNLKAQGVFDTFFNSKNFMELKDREFDTVWCSGVSAVKWWANQNPEKDWEGIVPLLDVLKTVKARHFILLSTVDVYQDCSGAAEDTPITRTGLHPYGMHRVQVEDFVKEHFPSHTIVRLPGLFGEGLKKNIIYDFVYDNEIDKIHSENVFQFYSLDTVYQDITTAVEHGLELVHFATEPVSVKAIVAAAFSKEFKNSPDYAPVSYDLHTKFGKLYGSDSEYIQSADVVLDKISEFVARHQEK